MAAGDIYVKTAAGVAEVTNRKMKLPLRLRTMLILIDGHQPTLVLEDEATKLGAPADFLAQLIGVGLIERVVRDSTREADAAKRSQSAPEVSGDEFSRFRAAKDFMNVTAVDALGIKSFFFTLKLERAGTVADLRELADAYRAAILKGSGEEEARVFSARLALMLT